jgi:hypothetical protein
MISVKWRDDLALSKHFYRRENYISTNLLLLTEKNHDIVEFHFL